MYVSKLLQMLFGLSGLFSMGIVEGEGGGGAGEGNESGNNEGEGNDGNNETGTKTGEEGKTEGKTKPTDAEARLLKEVMEKKTALKTAQSEAAALKEKLAQFDGLDPAELKKLVADKKAAETAELEAKGQWDRLKAQMAEENQKAIDAIAAEKAASDAKAAKLASQIAELTVGNSFVASKFIGDELTLPPSKARALYGPHFEFVDGKVVGYDKPAGSAERTALVDAQGEPLSFDLALKKLVDADPDRDQITKSKVIPGAGSKTQEKGKAPAATFEPPRGTSAIAAALAAGAMAAKK